MAAYKIGIDMGGTKTEAVLLNPENRELFRKRIPTPKQDGYSSIVQSVYHLITEIISLVPDKSAYTVGIGIPGMMDAETMLVCNANTTCLINHPFQSDLENLLNRRIIVENDANCFTLAESLKGAARGYELVFGIIMGTGCGGGICIHGKIRKGKHGIAGEWGHFSVDPLGAHCYCGKRGCIETKISGGGVESSFYRRFGSRLTMMDILNGYRTGDDRCRNVFLDFIEDFGRCVGGLISVLDPDAVVIGGGLSNIDELYTIGLDRIRHYAFHRHIRTPVLKNQLGDSAGVFGAAWIGI